MLREMRSFLIVWMGQACSLAGSMLVNFAIVWWLTRTTGSATVLTTATLAALLPSVLVGPFAGALVDRWDRKRVMILADGGIALATLVLAGLFLAQAATVWMIYALLLVRALGGAFHWPAMQASTTLLAPREQLARAAGMNQALGGILGIAMPALGALAVEAWPMQWVLGIDVLTALPAIACLLYVKIPNPRRAAVGDQSAAGQTVAAGARQVLVDLRDGLRLVIGWRAMLYLLLVGTAVGMLARAGSSLLPLMLTQHFGGGVIELGEWQSGYGVGLVLGGLLLGVWGAGQPRSRSQNRPRRSALPRIAVSMGCLALDGLICLGFLVTPPAWFPLTVISMGGLGVVEAVLFGLNGAIGQTIIPPEMQGRVFALAQSATDLAAPLGLLVAGPVVDRFGIEVYWLAAGLAIVLTGVLALMSKTLMGIEDSRPAPVCAARSLATAEE